MKAIVVFDVNDRTFEVINEYFIGVITLHLGNDEFIDFKGAELKPIPQYMTMKNVVSCDYNEGFVNGFDTCLDEILGEQNETEGTD